MCEDLPSAATLYHIGKKGLLVLDNEETVSLVSQHDPHWGRKFSPWKRLNQHHTASTASRLRKLEHRTKKNVDALDFCLSTTYDHAAHLFPSDYDIYLQNETCAEKERKPAAVPVHVPAHGNDVLVVGGILERRSPHSVRLNLSSHHMSRTAGGYGRKVDGSFYAA